MKDLIKSHARIAALLCGTVLAGVGTAKADQVIPDDLIVQGSLCVGFDCVNNESFGFATIRLKENNLRIEFMDTSVGAFPSNDWMITANDTGSGGASYLAFDDVTGGTQPFRVTAGAPTGSLWVDSTGRIGLRNTAPLLDLHMTTGNTPAIRLEQTNASGFAAQTWDVAGNEANFFVRDLTGGSRLPFRIRPGAPTSSIDIAASGDVGIGTASPLTRLSVVGVSGGFWTMFQNTDLNMGSVGSGVNFRPTASSGDADTIIQAFKAGGNTGANLLLNRFSGNVGVGTPTPSTQFHTTGGVRFAGVTGCGAGIQSDGSGNLSCIVSSRQFKTITGDLAPNVALANVMSLRPQTGAYKNTPDVPEHWLIAEEVGAVDPALVGLNEGKPYVVKTQNIVTDLVSVVQQQQARIEQLERKLEEKR